MKSTIKCSSIWLNMQSGSEGSLRWESDGSKLLSTPEAALVNYAVQAWKKQGGGGGCSGEALCCLEYETMTVDDVCSAWLDAGLTCDSHWYDACSEDHPSGAEVPRCSLPNALCRASPPPHTTLPFKPFHDTADLTALAPPSHSTAASPSTTALAPARLRHLVPLHAPPPPLPPARTCAPPSP